MRSACLKRFREGGSRRTMDVEQHRERWKNSVDPSVLLALKAKEHMNKGGTAETLRPLIYFKGHFFII